MIIVEGKIKGKDRPRFFRGHAVTPKETVAYERLVRNCYKEQGGNYFETGVRVHIVVYFKIPQSYTKKIVQAIQQGLKYPQKKPDVDNIAKIVLDSLNGVAYSDDANVIELSVLKRYTDQKERIEFEVFEI